MWHSVDPLSILGVLVSWHVPPQATTSHLPPVDFS